MTSNASISSKGFACRFLRKSLGIAPDGGRRSETEGRAAKEPEVENTAGAKVDQRRKP